MKSWAIVVILSVVVMLSVVEMLGLVLYGNTIGRVIINASIIPITTIPSIINISDITFFFDLAVEIFSGSTFAIFFVSFLGLSKTIK